MNTEETNMSQSCKNAVSGSTLISDCDLSIRTKKLFINAGLKTLDDIFEHTISDLMKFRGFGKRSLIELRVFLIRHNLSFEND
jgi:DNA-directed RNA polymerase alpha subunit